MCGRIACKQRREVYKKACCYLKESKYVSAEWVDLPNGGVSYNPSDNIAPSQASPILLKDGVINSSDVRTIVPMVWGIIPPWHKGSMKSHGLTTNNARLESIADSKLYGPLLKQGNRCVVIADGFYEWQTKNKSKQPYFIYSNQAENTLIEDDKCWETGEYSEETGWSGPKVLPMAGIYGTWSDSEGNEVYSYSVITKESKDEFAWLHHRVPAVLSTQTLVQDWLDTKTIGVSEAVKLLTDVCNEELTWHPVSTAVNNPKNKTSSCNKRIKLRNTLLTSWLKRGADQNKDEPSQAKVSKGD